VIRPERTSSRRNSKGRVVGDLSDGQRTHDNSPRERKAEDKLGEVGVSLGVGVVSPGDDSRQSVVERSHGGQDLRAAIERRNKAVEEGQGTDGLCGGEDKGARGRDGTARDGPVAGSLDEGIQRGVDQVVPDVNGVGDKDASSEQRQAAGEQLQRACLLQDGRMEDSEEVWEIDQADTHGRAESGQLNIREPGLRETSNPS